MSETTQASSASPAPPRRKGTRTPGTWSPEQARALGPKARELAVKANLARAAKRKRLIALSLQPSSSIPPILREQIAGATLQLEEARREGSTKRTKEWISVLKGLVELERLIENPPAKSTKAKASSSSKYLPPPVAGQSSDQVKEQAPTPDLEPEPIPEEPLE